MRRVFLGSSPWEHEPESKRRGSEIRSDLAGEIRPKKLGEPRSRERGDLKSHLGITELDMTPLAVI